MKKICNILAIIFIIAGIAAPSIMVNRLKEENTRLKENQEILLSEKDFIAAKSQTYKISDSLNAIKITGLQLSLSEYNKYRKQDLKLIGQLKVNKSDLQSVISSQTETINSLYAKLNDTIRIDTIRNVIDTVKYFNYKSKWTDVCGYVDLSKDTVNLKITNREAIRIVETAKYKRFLGFLWKTNKLKSRHIDIVSENPSTTITNVDYISISSKQ